jgi:hypothetical protein
MNRILPLVIVVALPLTALAQDADAAEQKRLKDWHSATQKAGLLTLGLAQGFGIPLMANKETLFSNGLCKAGDPMFWEFGCNGGLTILHFAFAATTLGLFITSEVLATQMAPSPYETGDSTRDGAASILRWVNVGLFTLQPILGLITAHPSLLGIPPEHRVMVSRILRSIHFAIGLGLVSTFTLQAGLQW